MDKYESPTIEQVGGGGKNTPDTIAALVEFVFLFTVVIDLAAILQAAAVAEAGLVSLVNTTTVSTHASVSS